MAKTDDFDASSTRRGMLGIGAGFVLAASGLFVRGATRAAQAPTPNPTSKATATRTAKPTPKPAPKPQPTSKAKPVSQPRPLDTRARRHVTSSTGKLAAAAGAGIYVYDWQSRTAWGYRAEVPYHLGSCVKVITAISVARAARARRRPMTATERDMITKAIRFSDNPAQTWCWDHTGGHAGFDSTARWLGLSAATRAFPGRGSGRSTSSAYDLVRVMNYLVSRTGPIHPDDARWIAGLMGTSTVTWGVGAMGRTAQRTVQVKNGWVLLDGRWRINSFGYVQQGKAPAYSAAILTVGGDAMETQTINSLGLDLWRGMRLGPLG